MTIKEKVIREAMLRINKRIDKIDSILDASPLIDIIELRKEAQELLKTFKESNCKELELKFSTMSKKEKELMKLAKYQQENTSKLITEKVKIWNELYALNSELYWINQRKN